MFCKNLINDKANTQTKPRGRKWTNQNVKSGFQLSVKSN